MDHLGPDDVGSGYPAVPPLGWQAGRPTRTTPSTGEADSDYAVDRRGRLRLRRRPERPTLTTPSTGEADSDYAVDRRGRLGLRRRPERPTRTTPSTGEADSDYVVDRRGRLGLRRRPERPTRDTCLHATEDVVESTWTYRVAREALACFQKHPSQPEQWAGCRRLYLGGVGQGPHGQRRLQRF
jgi:hypothetical protein